jgi:putative endonuclease
MFYCYIFYCGSAKDLKAREVMHNSGKGSKYVLAHGGGKIIYSEKFRKWGKALSREAEIKKLSRVKKLLLIEK